MVRDSYVYYRLGTSQFPVHETQTEELHEVNRLVLIDFKSQLSQCQPSESSHVNMSFEEKINMTPNINNFYVTDKQGYYYMFQLNTYQKLTVVERDVHSCVMATIENRVTEGCRSE